MQCAKKLEFNETRIIKLHSTNELEKYLEKYDISTQLFEKSLVNTEEDKRILKRYYDSAYEHAKTLVVDDELVGISFDNLDIMNSILDSENKKSKLVIRR